MPASASDLISDVLIQIFKHVSVSDPLKGPMSVSQVSQHWREAALKSSLIWSNVTVRLDTTQAGSSESQRHKLALIYFERSRKALISLTVDATRRFKPEEKVELLQPNTDRIRSLNIKASSAPLADLLWLDMDIQMPLLEEFSTIVENTLRIGISATNAIIIPPVSLISANSDLAVIHWAMWSPIGLTVLSLDTTLIQDIPYMDDIYDMLATTCQTLRHFTYQGHISSINYEADSRTCLAFPNLHSLTMLCHESMVPLLTLMIIPALETLVLRDFKVSPASTPAFHGTLMDSDQRTDLYGLYQAIKGWTSISRLEIYGIQVDSLPVPSNETSLMLSYLESLKELTTLKLYGIGIATLIATSLFKEKPQPLLPKLSNFLVGITEMSSEDHLFQFLVGRRLHELPRLQKLSINYGYFGHLRVIDSESMREGDLPVDYMDTLLDSSNEIYIFPDPEAGKFIPIEEEKLLDSERLLCGLF